GAPVRPAAPDDRALAHWLIERTAHNQEVLYRLAEQIRDGTAPFAEPERPIAAELLALLRCPDCRGRLEAARAGLRCPACGTRFEGEYGVPILYPARAGEPPPGDWLRRLCTDDERRMRTVAAVARRLRRNEAPPGALRRLFVALTNR